MSSERAGEGMVSWKSPSNIAIIKYWGKYGNQLPKNPSISFTLDKAHSITRVRYQKKDNKTQLKSFLFEGEHNPAFEQRIQKYLEKLQNEIPCLSELELEIESQNSFPHSSGIASSASGMSALALCLCDIEQQLMGAKTGYDASFFKRASHIARLGSGSASRSVFPILAAWGTHENIEGSHDEYAIGLEEVHEVFKDLHNDILIVSTEKKSVSSSAGHDLMNTNVFAEQRYKQAYQNVPTLLACLKNGDLEGFGEILENEALTLHALMMCSNPSYILMEPESLEIIRKIRAFRKEQNIPVYFSLDAGPNIHLMYPSSHVSKVQAWIEEQLKQHCVSGRIISDHVGNGPQKL